MASFKRIEDFLGSEGRPELSVFFSAGQGDRGYAARFEYADLGWGGDLVLSGVNLEIPSGSLMMVSGRISHGKSHFSKPSLANLTFFRAISSPLLSRRVGYVSQDIWLQERRCIREEAVFFSDDHGHDC